MAATAEQGRDDNADFYVISWDTRSGTRDVSLSESHTFLSTIISTERLKKIRGYLTSSDVFPNNK